MTSLYDEVRPSATHHESQDERSMLNSKRGFYTERFEVNTFPCLCCSSTQQVTNNSREPILRLKKRDQATIAFKEWEMKIFKGEKKTNIPDSFSKKGVKKCYAITLLW